ncbi:hypothetical protein [Bacillus thuringiensis]|uniref:Uncharacterized protein n=1 Tax=Bacillus thuringiensis Bt18247 TaxID=1423143 RepID=A0A9W3SZI3_BACTU|nr:hypothetical protein [Bacillus thuringiensis]AOM14191.1 hypothetical protein BTI247_58590 [Bacillus thuringiensis Bt18247]
MMGALKNHRDERVSVSVEELVPQDHFLRAIEATISFDWVSLPNPRKGGIRQNIPNLQ